MLLGYEGDYRLGRGADQAEELPDLADNLLMKFQDHLDLHDQECRPPTTPAPQKRLCQELINLEAAIVI